MAMTAPAPSVAPDVEGESAVPPRSRAILGALLALAAVVTQFWSFHTNLSDGRAASHAALVIVIAALPSAVLGRWFDRWPARQRAQAAPLPS